MWLWMVINVWEIWEVNISFLNPIFIIFLTKHPLSLLVTGRENGFQKIVTGRKNGFRNWLLEENVDANICYQNKKRMPIMVNRKILTQL